MQADAGAATASSIAKSPDEDAHMTNRAGLPKSCLYWKSDAGDLYGGMVLVARVQGFSTHAMEEPVSEMAHGNVFRFAGGLAAAGALLETCQDGARSTRKVSSLGWRFAPVGAGGERL